MLHFYIILCKTITYSTRRSDIVHFIEMENAKVIFPVSKGMNVQFYYKYLMRPSSINLY
jgi:hypothetical protein